MRVKELRLTYMPRDDLPRVSEINTPKAAFEYFLPILENEPTEHFLVCCLSTKYHALGFHVVAKGGINTCGVNSADVFRAAILSNAACVVVAHNHPSGDPSPSPNDHDLTRRLRDASNMLGIPLLDHVIIADRRYFSFKEQGLL